MQQTHHVLVGPGGAYAVETKWSGSSWQSDYGVGRLQEAIEQAKDNERLLRLWHPFKSQQIPVTAVVVLWGRGLSKWPEHDQVRLIDDVHVIAGPALRRWLDRTASVVLENSQVETAWAAMEAHVSRRDPIDAQLHPIPTSLAEWAVRSAAAVSSACLAILVFGRLLETASRWWVAASASLLLVLPAVIVRRAVSSQPVVWSAWAWGFTMLMLPIALTVAVAASSL
ncbi:nuclease-related domain-containing protein [Nocardioides vastitatis]|uniref:Nuclease-related domain-containing protein n=1 Tax=Nocardioides vastitatis TaxID=2568655 RepID=A0ABW0ZL60_9ACTN